MQDTRWQWVKGLLVVLLIAGALAAGIGYGQFQLNRERDVWKKRLSQAERKTALFKKKYAEKKALEAQFLRTKLAIEGQKRKIEAELKKLEKEKHALRQVQEGLERELEKRDKKVADLEKKIGETLKQYQDLDKKKKVMEKKFAETRKKNKEDIDALEAEKADLESRLQALENRIKRCVAHNTKLSLIAEQLLQNVASKGGLKNFIQKEPFTQIKKVELEHLIQEYRDRIDKEKITKQ